MKAPGGLSPEFAEQLWGAGFRVVCPDLRGHGESARPNHLQGWETDTEAHDIAALASHLELDHYSCVAYSHGTIEALRLLSLDDRLLCLVAGGMGHNCTNPTWERPSSWPEKDEGSALESDLKAVSVLRGAGLSRDAIEEALKRRLRSKQLRAMAWVQRGQACLSEEELARVSVPVKLVCGEKDNVNGDSRHLADMIRGCKLELIPGDPTD